MEKGMTAAKKLSRCALYVRVSTKQQVDKDYNSIESQKDQLLEYVNRRENYHVYKIYEDPAYSAKDSERPALQQMFDDVKKGKLDCVLVYKMDRLSRSILGFHKMVDTLEKHGVILVSITEHFDSSTVHGRFSRNIMMNFAQMEREMVSERTKDKLLERAKNGLWNGGRPYGYDCKDKKLIINKEEANVIRFMFDFFIHNASLARLRDELKARGIYTAKGYRWTASQISHKLRNPVYAGKIKHRDKVYPGIHEAIISESLFAKVQKLVPERTWSKRKTERTSGAPPGPYRGTLYGPEPAGEAGAVAPQRGGQRHLAGQQFAPEGPIEDTPAIIMFDQGTGFAFRATHPRIQEQEPADH